jgi:hypothetical protein
LKGRHAVADGERRKGRVGGWPCKARQEPGGPEWRERRMTERLFLDSESLKRAPCTKLSDCDLQYQEIAEGLGDSHSQAHTLFDPHGQGQLGI